MLISVYLEYLNENSALGKFLFKQVAAGNRKAIKSFIYRLLSGRTKYSKLKRSTYIELTSLFHNPNSSIEQLGKSAIKATRELRVSNLKTFGKKMSKETMQDNNFERRMLKKVFSDKAAYHLHPSYKGIKNPEEYIEISHGGGLKHLKDFFKGRSKGYKLEKGGNGIQVTPHEVEFNALKNRASMYASRAASRNFDDAVVMTGKIKRKYLKAANNVYEAGLTRDNLKHLKSIKIKKVKIDPGDLPI